MNINKVNCLWHDCRKSAASNLFNLVLRHIKSISTLIPPTKIKQNFRKIPLTPPGHNLM